MTVILFLLGWLAGAVATFLACWTIARGLCTLYFVVLSLTQPKISSRAIRISGPTFLIGFLLCFGAFHLVGWGIATLGIPKSGLITGAILPGVFALFQIPNLLAGMIETESRGSESWGSGPVHPPGSRREEIRKIAEQSHLEDMAALQSRNTFLSDGPVTSVLDEIAEEEAGELIDENGPREIDPYQDSDLRFCDIRPKPPR